MSDEGFEVRVSTPASTLRELFSIDQRTRNAVAHELCTPLTSLVLQVHFLKSAPWSRLPPNYRRSIEVVERNLHRLQAAVDELLGLRVAEAGSPASRAPEATPSAPQATVVHASAGRDP